MKYPYRQLIKNALMIAPIMVLTNIAPIIVNGKISPLDIFFLIIFALPVMLFYWGINILLIKLFEHNPKDYLRYFSSLAFITVVIFSITSFVDISGFVQDPAEPLKKDFSRSLMISTYITTLLNDILILIMLDMVISKYREKIVANENSELRIKNLESQQLQLRQQIQPHFLFNSLNTLKSLIQNRPIEAESYLVKLSSFLRYNLSQNEQDLISLKEELKITTDYLEIQKVRFKDALQYSVSISDVSILSLSMPIFAIQLAVENAIKHNALTNERPLIIEVLQNAEKYITVKNNLQEKSYTEESTRIGLKNLSERYQLLMEKDIKIIKTKETFEINLPLA